MKTLSEAEIHEMLERHRLWLDNDPSGKRAELFGVDLSYSDLRRADLGGADLRRADIRWADLSGADLSRADLRGAELFGVDLSCSDLRWTDLRWADLRGADLRRADLRGADLRGANLNVDDLSGANLSGANISETDIICPIACPEKGSFIAFKKAGDYIVELLIPENAKRCSATTRKCRCDRAMVVSITKLDGSDSGKNEVCSHFDSNFVYKIGEYVSVDNFEDNRWEACAPGIHFFITRQEAVNY